MPTFLSVHAEKNNITPACMYRGLRLYYSIADIFQPLDISATTVRLVLQKAAALNNNPLRLGNIKPSILSVFIIFIFYPYPGSGYNSTTLCADTVTL